MNQALNRLFSLECESESPEMVAGRLEIRVVSSPSPKETKVSTEVALLPDHPRALKSGLELLEEKVANQVNDPQMFSNRISIISNGIITQIYETTGKLPSVLCESPPSHALNQLQQPAKLLKSILKNKSDSSIGEKALRIDTRENVKRADSSTCASAEIGDTPEMIHCLPEWPAPKPTSLAESVEFMTAKSHHDGMTG